jgi:hypothetical protein
VFLGVHGSFGFDFFSFFLANQPRLSAVASRVCLPPSPPSTPPRLLYVMQYASLPLLFGF